MNNIIDTNLLDINAIPSAIIMLASSFHTSADENGKPSKMVLNIAIDREKSNADDCEFPVFLNADGIYKTVPHIEMLNLFRIGAPFVPVKCKDLRIFCSENNGIKKYFGTASKFEVVEYTELEDIL